MIFSLILTLLLEVIVKVVLRTYFVVFSVDVVSLLSRRDFTHPLSKDAGLCGVSIHEVEASCCQDFLRSVGDIDMLLPKSRAFL